ncbi:Cu(I)/Ag(I) efflux system membrane fusion protein [Paucibacter oligotrophus]|uniref:Cu(I)/Ag(I) efflux system membrane fusion protein n=1 Tax=Roseateles oligotrophus TaxID=1769250 RepID=A0A840LFG7_9BURK|nr:efflux RND transporter periplasmic adaptor subunit [Roseateles oligotrophus]MBB4845745.1 Cu(I)/Ag(I) efflux system membrane fusion protein [Roseateles oligotrophus]
MNTKKLLAGLSLIAAGIAMGWGVARWQAAPTSAQAAASVERKVLYWYDPMVPTQKFEKPGKSPFMDMALLPKYADEGGSTDAAGVSVSPQAIQSLGLRSASVEQKTIAASVDVVGTVLLNEREVSLVQARSAGFVERVYARAPGDVLAAGSPLVDLLLPEWVSAQGEFLAVKALQDATLTQAARQRLLLLGMPEALVAQVESSGLPQGRYTVTLPGGGLVAELMVRQGMTVSAGMSLARINGLASVWVDAALPETQSGLLQQGQMAELRLAAFPAEVFKARVIAVLPEASPETRTLRVRLELANPGLRFKPGMSGQVRLAGREQSALLLPSEAVIRTGKRALVYLVEGPGRFRPVDVQLGAEIGDKLVLLRGLNAGQQVVASAQFLIDSEASLQGVLPQQSVAAIPAASAPASAAVASFTVRGLIEALSATEMTLAHEAVPALQWPPMTMGFKLAKPRLAAGFKPGQPVRVAFIQRGDDYVITAVEGVSP